jgi:streptogramin lyase
VWKLTPGGSQWNASILGSNLVIEYFGSNTSGITVDANGYVYYANPVDSVVQKISPGGQVTTFVGQSRHAGYADGSVSTALFEYPSGFTLDPDGNLYVVDAASWLVRKVTPGGVVSTVAGTPD